MSNYDNLSKEELLKLVEKQEAELKTKKYGLVWDSEKEPEQVVLDCENNIPILQRVKEKEIKTDDSDDNILIEGDNYHALTCLNYTHKGKIDVIYIDPPYNTGKADEWKYNDKYVDENDGYRHSKWLNMMEKRLKLAINLLSEKGILFISINDYEFSQLKLISDSIFKEENFIDNFIIRSNPRGNQAKKLTASEHEYLLCYAKNIKNLTPLGFNKNKNEFKKKDNNRYYREIGLRKRGAGARRIDAPNQFYPIYYNVINQEISIKKNKDTDIEIFPMLSDGTEGRWRWSFKSVEENKHKLIAREVNRKGIKEYDIFEKDYFESDKLTKIKSIFYEKDVNYENATEELKEIFNSKVFEYPKPLFLIKKLLESLNEDYKTILDFFAGSGTTGHAVLELNKQDGGNRKFILCNNNENKICEEVTYPRIHNVIKGYKFKGKDKTTLFEQKLTFSQLKNIDSIVEEFDKTIEENTAKFDEIEKKFEDNTIKITGIKNIDGFKDGLNGNLQYFKTDLIPVERIDNINDHKRHELTEKAGQMIAIKENTFKELEINEWYQIFENKDKSRKTAIYFRENMDEFENLVKKIGKTKTVLYVFSYSRIDKKIFNYLSKNIVLEDIPEPILEIYKEINLTLRESVRRFNLKNELIRAKKHINSLNKEDGARVLRICIEHIIHEICFKNSIEFKDKKLSNLNDELKRISIFDKLSWEKNKTFIAIGNNASHWDYKGFNLKDLQDFYDYIVNMINTFNIK